MYRMSKLESAKLQREKNVRADVWKKICLKIKKNKNTKEIHNVRKKLYEKADKWIICKYGIKFIERSKRFKKKLFGKNRRKKWYKFRTSTSTDVKVANPWMWIVQINGHTTSAPSETIGTSRHYGTEGFKEGP